MRRERSMNGRRYVLPICLVAAMLLTGCNEKQVELLGEGMSKSAKEFEAGFEAASHSGPKAERAELTVTRARTMTRVVTVAESTRTRKLFEEFVVSVMCDLVAGNLPDNDRELAKYIVGKARDWALQVNGEGALATAHNMREAVRDRDTKAAVAEACSVIANG